MQSAIEGGSDLPDHVLSKPVQALVSLAATESYIQMLLAVDHPIFSAQQAKECKPHLKQWPRGEDFNDRLIEIVAYRLGEVWACVHRSRRGIDTGKVAPHLIFNSDEWLLCDLAFRADLNRYASFERAYAAHNRSHPYYRHTSNRALLGSNSLASIFQAALIDRFEPPIEQMTPGLVRSWTRPPFDKGALVLLDHLMSSAHRARREAFALRQATQHEAAQNQVRRH